MLEYLQMYPETFALVKRYTPEHRCFLYEAMAQYAFTGDEPDWPEDDVKWLIWEALKQRVDSAQRKAEKNRENGGKGGRPTKTEENPQKPNITQQNPTKPTETQQNPTEPGITQRAYTESDTDTDIDTEITRKKCKKKEALPRFTPPSAEDVKAYCLERGNSVNAERFVGFYASKGWKVGNQPMKDWKAAVRTWEHDRASPRAAPPKAVSAQQYDQREYVNAPAEEMPPWLVKNLANDPAFLAEHPRFLDEHPEAKEYIA